MVTATVRSRGYGLLQLPRRTGADSAVSWKLEWGTFSVTRVTSDRYVGRHVMKLPPGYERNLEGVRIVAGAGAPPNDGVSASGLRDAYDQLRLHQQRVLRGDYGPGFRRYYVEYKRACEK